MLEKFNFCDSFFIYVIHFSGQPCFLSTSQLSFAPEQLPALPAFNVLINNNNHLSVLFRTLVSSVKNENFRSTSVFYKVIIKNVIWEHVMRNRFEGDFIQTLLIQSRIYSLSWSDSRSELENPFLIKDFVSICRDLIFFDFILPLFCRCGRLLNNFLKIWR